MHRATWVGVYSSVTHTLLGAMRREVKNTWKNPWPHRDDILVEATVVHKIKKKIYNMLDSDKCEGEK